MLPKLNAKRNIHPLAHVSKEKLKAPSVDLTAGTLNWISQIIRIYLYMQYL